MVNNCWWLLEDIQTITIFQLLLLRELEHEERVQKEGRKRRDSRPNQNEEQHQDARAIKYVDTNHRKHGNHDDKPCRDGTAHVEQHGLHEEVPQVLADHLPRSDQGPSHVGPVQQNDVEHKGVQEPNHHETNERNYI